MTNNNFIAIENVSCAEALDRINAVVDIIKIAIEEALKSSLATEKTISAYCDIVDALDIAYNESIEEDDKLYVPYSVLAMSIIAVSYYDTTIDALRKSIKAYRDNKSDEIKFPNDFVVNVVMTYLN